VILEKLLVIDYNKNESDIMDFLNLRANLDDY
jgi:hypothetical protein